MNILFCTEQNVSIKCLDENLLMYLGAASTTNAAISMAVTSCLIPSRGCCSWRGGVDHYDYDQEVFICHDMSESPTCRGETKK